MTSYRSRHSADCSTRVTLGFLLILPLVLFVIGRIAVGIGFTQDVGGRLKRAADANSIALAETELQAALEGMASRGCTAGRSHIIWYTPACDVGFWHGNIEDAAAELKAFPEDADALTISNQLMKLRETLLDDGTTVSVTLPPNIAIFPSQAAWGGSALCLILLAILGGGIAVVALDARP